MTCPDENALLDFARGQLREDEALAVEGHLDGCDGCRAMVAEAACGPGGAGTPDEPAAQAGDPPAFFPRLGRYAVLDLVSAGGMGVVYAAYDPELDRKVALKLLRPESGGAESREEAQRRLLREAKAMARLAHPNIVAVHDAGIVGDQVFVAMELVDGGTLTDWLKSPRDWSEILEMFLQAGRGLAAAHAAGMVHRDFKPDNVLVGRDGRARVTDFGLARPTALAPQPTSGAPAPSGAPVEPGGVQSNQLLAGTPAYMSPEQLSGAAVSARSDQFGFCVALWEGLYGSRPFAGTTVAELSASLAAGRPPPPPPEKAVPAWVHHALARGLSASPADRYPFMEALLGALARSAAERRRRTWVAAFALALGVAGVAAAVQLARVRAERCEAASSRFAEAWNPGRQQALREAFAATGVPYAQKALESFSRLADRRVTAWASSSQAQCEAGEPESPCLELGLMELEAQLDRLSRADAAAVARAGLLTDEVASACPLTTGPLRPEAREALVLLSRARAEGLAAGAEAALPPARGAQLSLQRLSDRRLEAYGLLLLSSLQAEAGLFAEAEATAVSASVAAQAAGDSALAARAWLARLEDAGARRLDQEQAAELARHASAFLEASGGDAGVERALLRAQGVAALSGGEPARAALLFDQELGLRRAVADGGAGLGQLQVLRAAALSAQGKAREAIEAGRGGVALLEVALGAGHPRTVEAQLALGEALLAQGELEEARETFETVELALRAAKADDCQAARAEAGAGYALATLGASTAAIERFERAVSRQLDGCPEVRLAALLSLGERLHAEERHAEATDVFGQAARLAGRLERKSEAAFAALGLGRAALALGRPAEAIAPLEAAVRAFEGREREAKRAKAALAAALWRQGRERERARALALELGIPVAGLGSGAPPAVP